MQPGPPRVSIYIMCNFLAAEWAAYELVMGIIFRTMAGEKEGACSE